MINAETAYHKTKMIQSELNKIKQTEITKALDEINVLITDSIKRGEFSITVEEIPGLSQQTFNKISGILVTSLKQYGYQARLLMARLALVISWENV